MEKTSLAWLLSSRLLSSLLFLTLRPRNTPFRPKKSIPTFAEGSRRSLKEKERR